MRVTNPNREKSVKPITRINNRVLKDIDIKQKLAQNGVQRGMKNVPTGNLALSLADNANKYSKMKVQGEA